MRWLLTLTLVTGCFDVERINGLPPLGFETDVQSCSDGRDNDQDGLVDCQDPDCIGRWYCGEEIPILPVEGEENSLRLCIDRIDNDEDGQFDCGDRGCQAISELCCVTEISDVTCSDGLDNDGNGFADCADFACRNGVFVSVCNREDECDDGEDNDGDRFTDCDDRDCESDPICFEVPPEEGPENTVQRCMDNFDNDGNGFTDCNEFSCCGNRECSDPIDPAIGVYCAEIQENTVEKCTDDIDNDGNGFTDCNEFSCCPRDGPCIDPEIDEYCGASITEDTLERCSNGIDDDGNGFVDCDDNSCARADIDLDTQIPDDVRAERLMLRDLCEASFDTCTDGVDNERDGFVDCADFSCQGFLWVDRDDEGRTRVRSPCLETLRAPTDRLDVEESVAIRDAIAACSDGEDNDMDGFVDCADWDCHWNPFLNPQATDPDTDAEGFCQGWINPTLTMGQWEPPPEGSTREPVPMLCR